MRILFIVGSFLVYFFSSGATTDSHNFQNANEQVVKSQIETTSNTTVLSSDGQTDNFENKDEGYYGNDSEVGVDQKEISDYISDNNPVTWDEDPNNYPLETPHTYQNSYDVEVQSPTHYKNIPEGACAICNDGTFSFSKNRRGTCSRHGGVEKWLNKF